MPISPLDLKLPPKVDFPGPKEERRPEKSTLAATDISIHWTLFRLAALVHSGVPRLRARCDFHSGLVVASDLGKKSRLQGTSPRAPWVTLRATTRSLSLAVALSLLLGCAGDGGPSFNEPLVVTLVNKGSDPGRPLLEAKLHSAIDNYAAAPNLLSEPLGVSEQHRMLQVRADSYYLTVIRRQLSLPASELIALTTAEAFTLSGGHVVIWVFDESFRIFAPVSALDGGPRPSDGGTTGDGDAIASDAHAEGPATADTQADAGPTDAPVGGDARDGLPPADGASPDGPSPDGPSPDGPSPDGASPDGASPDRADATSNPDATRGTEMSAGD